MQGLLRILIYTSFFVFLVVVSSYVTFRVMGAKKTIEAPDLTGKSLVEANKELLSKRLYMKIEGEEFSTEVAAGYITRQDIPPGSKIKEGRTIRVVVSKGPRIYYMPVFNGLTMDEARELALKENIKIRKVIRVHTESFEKGTVVAQRPAPEEKGSDSVTLLVSKGPFETLYSCPDFREMPLDEAKALAGRLGIEIEPAGFGGVVAEQTPPPGSILKRGETVKLRLRQEEEEEEIRWL